ncbi:Fic family protein [Hydrogenimonas cancrithermarum]|uniref:Fic family protein n=1 Tax=Hydrogenimonas cancrithermarum TaxID=2993563 RepID=UPI0029F4A4DE|nr:Fic family protein [Hydrogenimonas cancrithermarum]
MLYYIVKGHPFSDGNKRIGAYLFVYSFCTKTVCSTATVAKRVSTTTPWRH